MLYFSGTWIGSLSWVSVSGAGMYFSFKCSVTKVCAILEYNAAARANALEKIHGFLKQFFQTTG
jgi:hypothetical protein